MGLNVVNYALAKKQVTSVVSGIKNMKFDSNGDLVIECTDGTILKRPFMDIKSIDVDPITNHLIITYTNNTKQDVGELPGGTCVFIGDTAPDHTKYKLWVDTSAAGSISGGGSSILTDDITATTVIGSVYNGKFYPAGTSLEVPLRDILISYSKPVATIGINPIPVVYDVVNDTMSSIQIIANVTKKTEDIEYVKFYVDNTLVNTTTSGVENGGQFKYTHTFSPATNKTFKVKIEVRDVTTQSVVTAQTTVTFIGRCYQGVIEDGTDINETNIKALTGDLKNKLGAKYTYTAVYGRFVYAYPKELGTITTAKDMVNNFNYTDSITKSTMVIDGIDYNIVYLTDPMGYDNLEITFA